MLRTTSGNAWSRDFLAFTQRGGAGGLPSTPLEILPPSPSYEIQASPGLLDGDRLAVNLLDPRLQLLRQWRRVPTRPGWPGSLGLAAHGLVAGPRWCVDCQGARSGHTCRQRKPGERTTGGMTHWYGALPSRAQRAEPRGLPSAHARAERAVHPGADGGLRGTGRAVRRSGRLAHLGRRGAQGLRPESSLALVSHTRARGARERRRACIRAQSSRGGVTAARARSRTTRCSPASAFCRAFSFSSGSLT